MDGWEIGDREEIARLQSRYNICGDRGQAADMASLFADDAVLNYRAGIVRGRANIAAALGRKGRSRPATGHDRPPLFLRHHLSTAEVEFDGPDQARGRVYFQVFTEIGADHMGVYVDRYARQDGAWRIAERTVRIDWVAEDGHSLVSRRA